MNSNSTAAVSVIHPDDFNEHTAQTSGATRLAAISTDHGVVSSQWAGIFIVEPLAKTGIHHHGEQETLVYVLEGESTVRWGERGEHSALVRAGDFFAYSCLVAASGAESLARRAFPLGRDSQYARTNCYQFT